MKVATDDPHKLISSTLRRLNALTHAFPNISRFDIEQYQADAAVKVVPIVSGRVHNFDQRRQLANNAFTLLEGGAFVLKETLPQKVTTHMDDHQVACRFESIEALQSSLVALERMHPKTCVAALADSNPENQNISR